MIGLSSKCITMLSHDGTFSRSSSKGCQRSMHIKLLQSIQARDRSGVTPVFTTSSQSSWFTVVSNLCWVKLDDSMFECDYQPFTVKRLQMTSFFCVNVCMFITWICYVFIAVQCVYMQQLISKQLIISARFLLKDNVQAEWYSPRSNTGGAMPK